MSDIQNYRLIGILPTLSMIYERCIYDQIYKYFDQIFSKYQDGFHQSYNTKNSLLMIIDDS